MISLLAWSWVAGVATVTATSILGLLASIGGSRLNKRNK